MDCTELTQRERRKLEQKNAILQRQSLRKMQKMARRIVKKPLNQRTREDTRFAEDYPDLIVEAEERRQAKLLEYSRQLEIFDDASQIAGKAKILADAISKSRHAIVYTGAGISTAADIPDYRGPNGLWTRQQNGQPCEDPDNPFDITNAEPTYTHMALVKLAEVGLIKFIVSQNCDGLHVRSGFPRGMLSEIHGNMYLEVCHECDPDREYFRTFDLTHKTRWRRHRTGRSCHYCQSPLHDTIVLFGEKSRTETPMRWADATHHAAVADVVVCLGTSLKVLKDYPSLWNTTSKLYIVNLQWTPKDDESELKINGRCDSVMSEVMQHLSLSVNAYDKSDDPLYKMAVPLRDQESADSGASCGHGWLNRGLSALKNKEDARKKKSKRKL
ncbi:NAD-dependent protein deacetylase sirtuin-7-like [Paramacrobiotus metropolitanus]|uniref:NAD-dependent protein deacetylase sirtuin-7-like n=1 Tax=Paramacrobiotus metropolitanus TaxID=2943436 RepID=UPI0024455F76|nr:NAD-dependent protein deacetylase sirtuin-7-like [Paramacrobiotus metropolitanus]